MTATAELDRRDGGGTWPGHRTESGEQLDDDGVSGLAPGEGGEQFSGMAPSDTGPSDMGPSDMGPGDMGPSDDMGFSDDELEALALAAGLDEVVPEDAVPLYLAGAPGACALPVSYMPPVMAGRARGWRVPVIVILVAAFLLVDAFGLCITYGQLVAA